MPKAEALRQLALAIDPRRLVVVICVRTPPSGKKRLRSLAQGVEWLAANTSARVVLVLPHALRKNSELDHVAYTNHVFADVPSEAGVSSAPKLKVKPSQEGPEEPAIYTTPVAGRPAPTSDTEQLLYERLTSDPELCPLFAYNQDVTTACGELYRVDLIWEEGKLVVELDGPDHRRPVLFARDRVRDYHLFMTGYQVVRFTNSRVIEQCEVVVRMIRDAVQLIRRRQAKTGVAKGVATKGFRVKTA
jgi:very-short-patch-repair endonuclease